MTPITAPLPDHYLDQCEHDARRFSGAWTGTSGTLAAHVMRLLAEARRMREDQRAIREQCALLAAKYEQLR